MLFGFLVNTSICLFYDHVLEYEYPHTTFLFRPYDRYQDFLTVLRTSSDLDPYRVRAVDIAGKPNSEVSNYFPFIHLLLYPATLYEQTDSLYVFLGICLLIMTIMFSVLCRQLKITNPWTWLWSWLIFVPLNYPVLFTLDRGNIEFIVFFLIAAGIFAISNLWKRSGAVLIGLAGAIKGFPLLFLYPLFLRRSFTAVALGIFAFLAASLISLAAFTQPIVKNIKAFHSALFSFSDFVLEYINGITHSISLFSGFYTLIVWYNQQLTELPLLREWRNTYGILTIIFLFSLLSFLWFRRKDLDTWRQWALLFAAAQILPHPSYDYKLLYSLIPAAMIVVRARSDERKYVWLYGLLLIPKTLTLFADVRWSVLINPALILLSIYWIVSDSFKINIHAQQEPNKSHQPNLKLADTTVEHGRAP